LIDVKLMVFTEHIDAVRGKHKAGKKPLNKSIDRRNPQNLIGEVLSKIGGLPSANMVRPLRINFVEECAIDDGACSREMFSQFFDKLFCESSQQYFECEHGQAGAHAGVGDGSAAGEITSAVHAVYLPKAGLIKQEEKLVAEGGADPDVKVEKKLEAIGKVLMKSLLMDDVCMALCVPPSFFDYLIEPRYTVPADVHDALNSLSFFDQQLSKSLGNMLSRETTDNWGGMSVGDLDGSTSEELLTSANLPEAIRGKVWDVLVGTREPELKAIRRGFTNAVTGLHAHLGLFRGAELMNFMCGEANVTAAMLLQNTKFVDVSTDTESWVRRFIETAEEKVLKDLLAFVTGLSVMPNNGLRMAIKVQCANEDQGPLLRAAACYFQLFVPAYSWYKEFEEKVGVSLSNGAVGFGLR
jgi:hypothetical protein